MAPVASYLLASHVSRNVSHLAKSSKMKCSASIKDSCTESHKQLKSLYTNSRLRLNAINKVFFFNLPGRTLTLDPDVSILNMAKTKD